MANEGTGADDNQVTAEQTNDISTSSDSSGPLGGTSTPEPVEADVKSVAKPKVSKPAQKSPEVDGINKEVDNEESAQPTTEKPTKGSKQVEEVKEEAQSSIKDDSHYEIDGEEVSGKIVKQCMSSVKEANQWIKNKSDFLNLAKTEGPTAALRHICQGMSPDDEDAFETRFVEECGKVVWKAMEESEKLEAIPAEYREEFKANRKAAREAARLREQNQGFQQKEQEIAQFEQRQQSIQQTTRTIKEALVEIGLPGEDDFVGKVVSTWQNFDARGIKLSIPEAVAKVKREEDRLHSSVKKSLKVEDIPEDVLKELKKRELEKVKAAKNSVVSKTSHKDETPRPKPNTYHRTGL